jgi:putative heme-binding domain-containing protein
MEHAVINALHHLATPDDFRAALKNDHPRIQRAALILLDQPNVAALKPDDIFPRLSSTDPNLRSAAQWLLKRHPDWSDQALSYIRLSWKENKLSPERFQALAETIIAFSANPKITDWLGDALSKTPDQPRKLLFLHTLSRILPPKTFDSWIAPLRSSLQDPALAPLALTVISSLNSPQFDSDLRKILSDTSLPDSLRLQSLRALISRAPTLDQPSFNFLLSQFAPTTAPSAHFSAAEIAARASLTEEQFIQLIELLKSNRLISPETLLPLLSRTANPETTPALLSYLKKSIDSGWRPPPEKLEPLLKILAPKGDDLLAILKEHQQNQIKHLTDLEPLLKDGDPRKGREIFFSNQVACSTCHRIGAQGGLVGPDLTKVGAIRAGRDILESIVFPASTIAQGYDHYILDLKNGDQLTGVIAERTDATLTLRDSASQTRIIRMSDVKNMRRDTTSLMPQGLDTALTPEQFRDLLAYLQSLK